MRSLVVLGAALAVASALSLSRASWAQSRNLRPTEPGAPFSYGGATPHSFAEADGAVRVWWVESTSDAPNLASTRVSNVPDAVVRVAEIAEEARAEYRHLGFLDPLPDLDSPVEGGREGLLDIYLIDFASADGATLTNQCTESEEAATCAGFMLIDNDFAAGSYQDFDEGARTVVPHEYFNLVQAAYDAGNDAWWNEATAQWAAKHVYPELTDLERFLPAYFRSPNRPLDAPSAGAAASFLYGTAIWPVFLEETRGISIVREIFEDMAGRAGPATASMDTVLARHQSSLADAFAEFAVRNVGTGSRASSEGYAHASDYPELLFTSFPDELPGAVSGVTTSLSARYYELTATQPTALELGPKTKRDRTRVYAVSLEGGIADVATARELPVTVTGDTVIVVAGTTALKSDAAFDVRASVLEDSPGTGGEGGATGTAGSEGGGAASQARGGSAGDSPLAGVPGEPEPRVDSRSRSACACGTAGTRREAGWAWCCATLLALRGRRRNVRGANGTLTESVRR